MLVVLEGLNGVGKTSVLSTLGLPRFKPFRPDPNAHWDQEEGVTRQQALANMGIPLNTYVEDIFSAEFLAHSREDFALDRSLPSALAYGKLDGTVASGHQAGQLLAEWITSLGRRPDVYYAWLTCHPSVARERAGKRAPNKAEAESINSTLEKCFKRIPWNKRRFDTTEATTEQVAASMASWLGLK